MLHLRLDTIVLWNTFKDHVCFWESRKESVSKITSLIYLVKGL